MLVPDENDEIILEIRRVRRELEEWKKTDPVGWAEYSKQCLALSTGKSVKFSLSDAKNPLDSLRYEDLCGPLPPDDYCVHPRETDAED